MQIYSNNEKNNAFPRTYFSDVTDPLYCSTYGGPAASAMTPADDGYHALIPHGSASFDPGTVPNNCVTASIFLLLKSTDLTPDIFVCPSSNGIRGFTLNSPKNWANFEDTPNWGQHMTYSFACMFPGSTAENNGFRWASTMANPSDFALAADMNPGNSGGINPPNQVTLPTHASGAREMARGNSNNHNNAGQNVLYADGHVQWQTSPFCGVACVNPTAAVGFNDNIYTARVDYVTRAEGGFLDNVHFPCDGQDSYLLPTDDGKSTTAAGGF